MARRKSGPTDAERKIWSAITGKRAADRDDVPAMLQTVYGTTRAGNVDAKAAAKRLGVSQSTIRRWAKGQGRPDAKSLRTMRANTTRSMRSQKGAQLDSGKAARWTTQGARVSITGNQGVRTPGRDYIRSGYSITYDLSPDALKTVLNAWSTGTSDDVRAAIAAALGDEYVDGWAVDTIDQLSIT